MTRFAEGAGGRADEDEAPVPALRDAAEKAARGQERRGQVRAQRRVPALERELPDGQVLRRPDACDRGTDVEVARLVEEPVDVGLDRQVRADRLRAAELGGGCVGTLTAAGVVHDNLAAFRCECTRAGCADSAGRAGDEDALTAQPGLQSFERLSVCASS